MHRRNASLVASALLLTGLAACKYNPSVHPNTLKCKDDNGCPSGYRCVAGACCNNPTASACLGPADGAATDATLRDALADGIVGGDGNGSQDLRSASEVSADRQGSDVNAIDSAGTQAPDSSLPGFDAAAAADQAGTGGTMGTSDSGEVDAPVATGGVGGTDALTDTDGASITDGPTATNGPDARDAPVATGGTDAGGTAGASGSGGTTGTGGTGGTGGTSGSGGATGSGGTGPAPAIISFTVSSATISAGQSTTLSWTVTGATTLSIDQGVGSALGKTSQMVTPTQTTTYTLTLNGSMSAQVTVTVVPPPSITSFGASSTTISVGGSVTLTAVFSGGTGSVDHGIGSLTSAVGKSSGAIAATTTYTLTVTNAAGDSTSAQVTVTVVPPPSIASFVASPTVISIGGSATLTGVFSGGTGIVDQGIGTVTSGGGTSTGALAATTTYTLTVTNSVGDSTAAQVTVTVVPLPSITSFGASPTAVNLGGSATLTAVFSGGTGTVDHGVGTVTSGSGKSTGPVAANTAYTLTVTSPAGDSTTAQVTVVGGISTLTGSMTAVRSAHTATSFGDLGKVLITGGSDPSYASLASAEVYAPAAATFTATTGSMSKVRTSHTATLLTGGMVLIVGGGNSAGTAELYDPSSGTFAATGSLSAGVYAHTATLLQSGVVLVAGGVNSATAGAGARLYDPGTAGFTATGGMHSPRASHTATLLPNGKVLVVGGEDNNDASPAVASSDLYDPSTGTFTASGSMTVARYSHTATLLPSGKVLVVGGNAHGNLASAELYDPSTGAFTATGSMTVARSKHTATLLSNGKVLIAGGGVASTELYDPSTGTFAATGNMTVARSQHTATLLPSGMVLLAGGSGDTSAELFK